MPAHEMHNMNVRYVNIVPCIRGYFYSLEQASSSLGESSSLFRTSSYTFRTSSALQKPSRI